MTLFAGIFMHIGILQAGHTADPLRDRLGDFDEMFRRLLGGHGFSFTAWDVENMVFPISARDADGWLVTGSRHGAYEIHPFIPPLENLVRDIHTADIPLVGICFGHQIIAQALGGRVEKFDRGWSVGHRDYTLTDGETIALNAWHQDQVVDRPKGASVMAANGFCENAILAYGRHAFTVQPHPEFSNDLISEYVALRRGTGTYPDALMDDAARNVDRPIDDGRIADAIARFFKTRDARV